MLLLIQRTPNCEAWSWQDHVVEFFAGKGTGALQKIDGIMRKEDYLGLLKQHLKTRARKLKFSDNWIFQQDTDPKHTSNAVTKWLQNNRESIGVVSQSADLNPIGHLWAELKSVTEQDLSPATVIPEEWVKDFWQNCTCGNIPQVFKGL